MIISIGAEKGYDKIQNPFLGKGVMGILLFNRHRISVQADEEVLEEVSGNVCTILCAPYATEFYT